MYKRGYGQVDIIGPLFDKIFKKNTDSETNGKAFIGQQYPLKVKVGKYEALLSYIPR